MTLDGGPRPSRSSRHRPFDRSPIGTFQIRGTCRVPDRKRSGYAGSRGCTSRLILSADARVARSRSYAPCRFILRSVLFSCPQKQVESFNRQEVGPRTTVAATSQGLRPISSCLLNPIPQRRLRQIKIPRPAPTVFPLLHTWRTASARRGG